MPKFTEVTEYDQKELFWHRQEPKMGFSEYVYFADFVTKWLIYID